MKKYFIFLLTLLCIFNINAEHFSNRKSNPNYKNLKVYFKVLERYGTSNFYLSQIDIVNTGNSKVTFWADANNYSLIFDFSARGVWFVNEYERQYYEKNKGNLPSQKVDRKKIGILPYSKYIIKTWIYIYNKEQFLRSNKNLKIQFFFNDAYLEYGEDATRPYVISENAIVYDW